MGNVYRSSSDPYLWFIGSIGSINFDWGYFQAQGLQSTAQWLTVRRPGQNREGALPVIDLSSNEVGLDSLSRHDPRLEDRVTFDVSGTQHVMLRNVEYVDSSLTTETHLRHAGHFGFTTDGSLESIHADVGNHAINFTAAIKDSSLFLGDGFDVVRLGDHLDVPGEQYWSLIRREGNMVDAYSLLTGRRVRMEDGNESLNGIEGNRNFGEIEQVIARFSNPNDPNYPEKIFVLGGPDIPNPGDQGLTTNIDLRSDGQQHSDSFNLAYFNFIRYTSDNVWVGEATIHDGTRWSTPSDRTVTSDKYDVTAPTLDGQLSVIGSSRNGTHDLIVEQQETAIDGLLRLYTFNVASGLYNQFNHVYLGDSVGRVVDMSSQGSGVANRVALYGFGGNDTLIGGAGRDYLFGGQSSYDPLASTPTFGNEIIGGGGADFFGVGHTDRDGNVVYISPLDGRVLTENERVNISTAFGNTASVVRATATDRIMDWDAGQDTLYVLENGVAIIENIKSLYDINSTLNSGGHVIDLRSYLAIATSDQNGSGARAGDHWDQTQTLDYIFENQNLRDSLAIANEVAMGMTALGVMGTLGRVTNYAADIFNQTDVTVRNKGVIVTKGGAGNDTIYGSFGSDYIYGGAGSNLIYVSPTASIADGEDKVFVDSFFSQNEVRNFRINEDKLYLNADILTAIKAGNGWNFTSYDNGDFQDIRSAGYLAPKNLDPNISGPLGIIFEPYKLTYKAILNSNLSVGSNGAWSNQTHWYAFDQATTAMIVAGSLAVATGTAMLFNPFTAIPGAALVVTGASQIAAGAIAKIDGNPHQNAQIQVEDRSLITLLPAKVERTTSLEAKDNLQLLDFFYAASPNDGFKRALEFTVPQAGSNLLGSLTDIALRSAEQRSEIVGYFAVHSDKETFVYRVASSDRIITDDETFLVAEVSGLLTGADLEAYLGSLDIYNSGLVAPQFGPGATLSITTDLSGSGRTSSETLSFSIALERDLQLGEAIEIFRDDVRINPTISGSMKSFTFVDNVSSVAGEEIFSYYIRTISVDGIARSSNTVGAVVDKQAPEVLSVSVGGDNKLSVIISGNDISQSEPASVRLKAGDSIVSSTSVTESGSPVELFVPPGSVGAGNFFVVEAMDARGNSATSLTKIFTLSDGNDTFFVPEAGAITFGLGGSDTITGTSGSDVISGGSGNDVLNGGGGDDILIGGSGADTFVIGSFNSSGLDFIADFRTSDGDIIQLSSSLRASNPHSIFFFDRTGVDYGSDLDSAILSVASSNTGSDGSTDISAFKVGDNYFISITRDNTNNNPHKWNPDVDAIIRVDADALVGLNNSSFLNHFEFV
jgi:hypothetical protein